VPHVIVVESPRYAGVYRTRVIDDRTTLAIGERWAEWVDENADSVATPDYLAEHSTDRTRPSAHLGNTTTHCVVGLPSSWQGRVPSYYRPGRIGPTRDPRQLRQDFDDRRDRMRNEIVDMAVATYERAARWSAPNGVVSILVGHGNSQYGVNMPGSVNVDLAPASAATADTDYLRALRERVEDLRRGGRSFNEIATPRWDPDSTTVLRMGKAFRRWRVRRVDLLVCRAGVDVQGPSFLTLLARFWGAEVRGLRGTSTYYADGHWDVRRPIRPTPRFSMRLGSERLEHEDGDILGTNLPSHRNCASFLEGSVPGYPADAMFVSSRRVRPL